MAASSFTETEIKEFIDLWTDAYKALTTGKSYSINTGGSSRSLTRQDLKLVREELQYWQGELKKLETASQNRGLRVKFITPLR